MITGRYLAVGVLFGVTSVESIVSVTLSTFMTQVMKWYTILRQEHYDLREYALSILMVFAGATAHWMSLRHIAQLHADCNKLANERDSMIGHVMPHEVQVAIVAPTDDGGLKCLQQTRAFIEKLYPDAHRQAGLKWLDARLIGNEKFREINMMSCDRDPTTNHCL